jgi:cell wall-associated NlpC family hydrolase
VLDCWSIVRDYYRQELGITLPDFEREGEWWRDIPGRPARNRYVETLPTLGFEFVADTPRTGDVFLMQVGAGAKTSNHAAVYLGDGLILHHVQDRLSSRDMYGGYWQHCTTHRLRHRSLNG